MIPDRSARAQVWGGIGALVALAVAAVLASVDGGLGTANVALLLALVVAAFATLGGPFSGALAGGAAALSFNFFHTEPRHSLRIAHPQDVVTVGLLVVVGLVVGELGRRSERSRWDAGRSEVGLQRVVRMAELARAGVDADTAVVAATEQLRRQLSLASATFDAGASLSPDRPVLDGTGALVEPVHRAVGDGFALDPDGVELAVTYRGVPFGRLLLVPRRPVGLSASQLRGAVAIADQLGAVLWAEAAERRAGPVDGPGG